MSSTRWDQIKRLFQLLPAPPLQPRWRDIYSAILCGKSDSAPGASCACELGVLHRRRPMFRTSTRENRRGRFESKKCLFSCFRLFPLHQGNESKNPVTQIATSGGSITHTDSLSLSLSVTVPGIMRAVTLQRILVQLVALVVCGALSASAFHTVSTSSVSAPWAVRYACHHPAGSGAVTPINVSARRRIAAALNIPGEEFYLHLDMLCPLPPCCPPHELHHRFPLELP